MESGRLFSREEWRARGPAPDGHELMFPGTDGGALRANAWRARYWRPAIKATGLEPLRPHDLRHTAVALWIAAGASPKQIATRAGHTSVALVLDRQLTGTSCQTTRSRYWPPSSPSRGPRECPLVTLSRYQCPKIPRGIGGVRCLRGRQPRSRNPSDLDFSSGR